MFLHYRAGGLLQYRAFYYIIGQLLHYRAFFITLSGSYYSIGRLLHYRLVQQRQTPSASRSEPRVSYTPMTTMIKHVKNILFTNITSLTFVARFWCGCSDNEIEFQEWCYQSSNAFSISTDYGSHCSPFHLARSFTCLVHYKLLPAGYQTGKATGMWATCRGHSKLTNQGCTLCTVVNPPSFVRSLSVILALLKTSVPETKTSVI